MGEKGAAARIVCGAIVLTTMVGCASRHRAHHGWERQCSFDTELNRSRLADYGVLEGDAPISAYQYRSPLNYSKSDLEAVFQADMEIARVVMDLEPVHPCSSLARGSFYPKTDPLLLSTQSRLRDNVPILRERIVFAEMLQRLEDDTAIRFTADEYGGHINPAAHIAEFSNRIEQLVETPLPPVKKPITTAQVIARLNQFVADLETLKNSVAQIIVSGESEPTRFRVEVIITQYQEAAQAVVTMLNQDSSILVFAAPPPPPPPAHPVFRNLTNDVLFDAPPAGMRSAKIAYQAPKGTLVFNKSPFSSPPEPPAAPAPPPTDAPKAAPAKPSDELCPPSLRLPGGEHRRHLLRKHHVTDDLHLPLHKRHGST